MLCLLSQLEALLASVLYKTCILVLHLMSLRLVRSAEKVHLHLPLVLTPLLSLALSVLLSDLMLRLQIITHLLLLMNCLTFP